MDNVLDVAAIRAQEALAKSRIPRMEDEHMRQKVGFMGLGIMGKPMATNLIKAGYPTIVYNRTRKECKPCAGLGAEVASTPQELAGKADVIIIMVTGPEAVSDLLFGENGAAGALNDGKTLINMSSVSPAYTKELDRKLKVTGVTFIDAPVSGSKKPAEDATLLILAGGAKDKIDEINPLLASMGKKVIYCGEVGQGSMMKMANNLLLGLLMAGLCETVCFGVKGGLSKETLLEVILSGPLNAPIFGMKSNMLREGEYPVNFPFRHMRKDLKFVVDTAFETGASIPLGHQLLHIFNLGLEQCACGDLDVAAVMKVFEHG
jgi:3-hydroxyisobutyrate dehydrogenase-like beta-hydroxyacid dehydrogenase